MTSSVVAAVSIPQKVKATRDNKAVAAALAKIKTSAALKTSTSNGDSDMNLLALSVDAAAKRCDSVIAHVAIECD